MQRTRGNPESLFDPRHVLIVLLVGVAVAALAACLGEEPAGPDCAVIAQAVAQCDDEPLAPDFMAECEAASVAEREAMAVAGQACAARKADGIFGYLDEGEECWTNHLCGDGLICRMVCRTARTDRGACPEGQYVSQCLPPGGIGDSCDASAAALIPEGRDADCAEGLLCHGYICRSDVGGPCNWYADCASLHCSTDSLVPGPAGTCLAQ